MSAANWFLGVICLFYSTRASGRDAIAPDPRFEPKPDTRVDACNSQNAGHAAARIACGNTQAAPKADAS